MALANGGLDLITVQDDGCGIQHNDLPLLCARHSTSKLKCIEDLQKIGRLSDDFDSCMRFCTGTFGFRGEALAAVSRAAHVNVTTKVVDADAGYQQTYKGAFALAFSIG